MAVVGGQTDHRDSNVGGGGGVGPEGRPAQLFILQRRPPRGAQAEGDVVFDVRRLPAQGTKCHGCWGWGGQRGHTAEIDVGRSGGCLDRQRAERKRL